MSRRMSLSAGVVLAGIFCLSVARLAAQNTLAPYSTGPAQPARNGCAIPLQSSVEYRGFPAIVYPALASRVQYEEGSAVSHNDAVSQAGQPSITRSNTIRLSVEPPVQRGERAASSERPLRSLLLPSEQPTHRSEQLERIARQADRHTRRGFELAGRRAPFSARLEFIGALQLLAEALDAEHNTDVHGRCLSAGLTAIKEAEDFIPMSSRLESNRDIPVVIDSHRTPVLKNSDTRRLASFLAMKCYFTFAQEQLSTSVGREVAGSMALHGLGKLYAALASQGRGVVRAAEPKAMVFYQAALLVYPENSMTANDLGVLLARCGDYREAESALRRGLAIQSQSTGWHNLAMVYGQLGQRDLALRADQQAVVAARSEAARRRSNPKVRWFDPDAFACNDTTVSAREKNSNDVVPCQALGPAAPCNICAVDCSKCCTCRGWESARAIGWQAYAQGEYVAYSRLAHVPEYRLRVDDQLDLVYRLTREETSTPYKLNVGDEIRVESFTDKELDRDLIVQPDGAITLRLLGQVQATGRTVSQLRSILEKAYTKYYKTPSITVTPLKVNTKLEDLRAAVDCRAGLGGQSQLVRVTPEGTVALPAIGSVYAQGLNLGELRDEINEQYREVAGIEGIEVIPVLARRAPRFVYVLGEVATPGRFEMTGPTTVLQAIGMAGSWNNGAHLRQIVVFRRGDDWRLMATMLDLRAALHGKQPCPPGEIWLSDSDVIIVPKRPILVANNFIERVFTRGIYGVFPLKTGINFLKLSSL